MRIKIMALVVVLAICGVLFLYKDVVMDMLGFAAPNANSNINDVDYSIQDSGVINQNNIVTTPSNKADSAPLNNQICDSNNSSNCLVMAKSHIENNQIIQALGLLIQGCEYKNAESCLMLADLYSKDNSIDKSKYIYFGYIEKSCNLDNIDACYKLGVKYYRGDGIVDKNMKKSFDLFKKVCDSGNMEGCNNLAVMYNNGDGGIKKDLKLAKDLFDKACKSGYQPSCDNIKKVFN